MKIFPPEPDIKLYEEGFEHQDILQRASVGTSLSDLIERIEDPLVIALDGGWGTGKTYFLKRWVGAHGQDSDRKATPVYFDAFASDYLSDPLPALVSAIGERFPREQEGAVDRMKSAAFKFAKPIARIGLAFATYGATEVASAAGDAVINAASGEVSKALEQYWSQEDGRRAAMEEFRLALMDIVAGHPDTSDETEEDTDNTSQAGLVIVIDELDRCRPDYALEVLEVIKHFFSIPGVRFVLGVNLSALENSVKARYGDNFDASAYLRKFINVTFSLPSKIGNRHHEQDAVLVYLKHHLTEMRIPEHIVEPLVDHIKLAARNNQISIRDVGKILSSIPLLRGDILEKGKVMNGWIDVTVTLLVSKVLRPDLHPKFLNATITESDLEDYFDATVARRTDNIDDDRNKEFDHDTWVQFHMWVYLSSDGKLPDSYSQHAESFARQFDSWGRLDSPRLVPKKANRFWIDLFHMADG